MYFCTLFPYVFCPLLACRCGGRVGDSFYVLLIMINNPIITLTTDWGTDDFFVGMAKGFLFSNLPDARIVDITHHIPLSDSLRAYYVVRHACSAFPPGTIHLIDIATKDACLVLNVNGRFFISADNGLPHALFINEASKIDPNVAVSEAVSVSLNDFSRALAFDTFPGYSALCRIAVLIAKGASLSELGPAVALNTLQPLMFVSNVIRDDSIRVYVEYVDTFGNVDLSITYVDFERIRNGRPFAIHVRNNDVTRFARSYSDPTRCCAKGNSIILTVSATGHLQLAMRNESFSRLLGFEESDFLEISFSNPV